jgi:hypothetical protein
VSFLIPAKKISSAEREINANPTTSGRLCPGSKRAGKAMLVSCRKIQVSKARRKRKI